MPVEYDPRLPDVNADPFPIFRRLQDEDPVHWCEPLGSWVLTRYADVRRVALGKEMSADRLKPFFAALPDAQQSTLRDLQRYLNLWAVFRDPPAHTRMRALMNTAFTPRAVEGLRPNVEAIVSELIDAVAERGEMDVIADLAYPLPATVIMDMLGVPRADLAAVKMWSDDMALFVGGARTTPDKYARAEDAARRMADYFRCLVAERRKRPRQDMTTALIAAEEQHQRLSEDEIVASCMLLLFAGHETTANLMGNGILALIRHPDELRKLRANPALVEGAVEECLRYDGPSGALARVVGVGHDFEGRALAPGDRVYAMLNAANRDPRRFADPDRFDIERGDKGHLTFGHGLHYCLGAPLARIEGQAAVREVVGRLDDLELASEALVWLDSLILRGVKSLPVRFRAAPAGGRPARPGGARPRGVR
ncbi:MAG: cytochrome P450 [Pseudomonadota bacterium]